MSDAPVHRAADWLERTYGGLVTLADPEPIVEHELTSLFGCRYADHRYHEGGESMLAATICVPQADVPPFPVSNSKPLSEPHKLAMMDGESWRWQVNARNSLVAVDAAVDQRPASALSWHPWDEAPGWWRRLLDRHFSGAEVSTCSSWRDVTSAILEGGQGTRGVVWVRRQFGGRELTGHLLYAVWHEDGVVVLDGQTGTLAQLDDHQVDQLVLARFFRTPVGPEQAGTPAWERAADDFPSAVAKAESWLDYAYSGAAVLVMPDQSDERERGWLFACTTTRFRSSGDWRDQMLDAALVVPKAAGESPFGLPNHDPWTWLDDWNAGRTDLTDPPEPGAAAWFDPTTQELGPVLSVNEHVDWAGVLSEITRYASGAQALIWLRRQDDRGRETVGNLIVAAKEPNGVHLGDAMAEDGWPAIEPDPLHLHVIRFG